MKKVLFIVAAATLFFSCQKEIEPTTPAQSKSFSFTAAIENLATKAEINSSNELIWATGDKIGIYVNEESWGDGKNQPFTLESGAGSTTAKFTWDYTGEFSSNAAAAFFPWNGSGSSATNVYGDNVYFKLPGSYGNDEAKYTSGQMFTPLVAALENSESVIEFKHAGAAVKVTINNLPVGVHSLGMSVDGQQVYGDFHVAYADAGTAAMSLDGAADASKNTIWLNITPNESEGEFVFLFPVPALTTPKLSFQMYDENNVLVWKKNLKAQTSNLERGDVLEMPALDITPYAKFNQISSFGVCGSFNGWAGDTPMITDGTFHIAKGMTFDAGTEFKIRKDGGWDESYGEGCLNPNDYSEIYGSNVKITTAGTYDIIFDSSSHKITVAAPECPYPTVESLPHHSAITDATALGASETANCYIITAPGAYKIPVVKGNSSESAGTVGGVQLLWETYNNDQYVTANSLIAAVDYDEEENYIYFKTPDALKPGNAGIAALDADNNIIWSWHIWIPADAIQAIGDYHVSKKYYMDRNLGALVVTQAAESIADVQSYGMLYQWGRKDPFPGARAFNSSDRARTIGVERFENLISEDTGFDLAASYANPMTFAKNSAWRTGVEQWNPGGNKSIDDPCPAGYKVPDYDSSDLLWGNVASDSEFSASSTYGWWKIGQFVFPLCGYCESGGSMSHAFDRSRIITNDMYTSTYPEHEYAQYLYESSGSWVHDGSTRKRYASSVRCVKIEGEVPEPEEQPITQGPTSITIDGSFSDWTGVEAAVASTTGPYYEFKVAYDDTYLYFYSKRNNNSELWGEDPGYFYYLMDIDHDKTTEASVNQGIAGVDKWVFLYMFGGSSDAPVINSTPIGQKQVWVEYTCAENACSGAIGTSYVETEIRLPRADFGIEKDQQVRFYSFGNKSASNIKTTYTYLKIEN